MLTQWRIIALKFLRDKKGKTLRNQFIDIWEDLPPEEKRDAFIFLFQARQWKFFSELFLAELREGNPNLHWEFLLTAFEQKSLKFPELHRITLQKVLKKSKVSVKEFDTLKDIIEAIVTKKKYIFLQNVQHRKQELLASAKIAQSERLFDQQMSYLNKLKALFPKDINIRENIYEREKVNAEKILNRAQRTTKDFSKKDDEQIKQEKALIRDLKEQAHLWVQEKKGSSQDLAVMFRQFGYINEGMDFLDSIEDSEKKDWFIIDFLFNAKQYITLLSHCEQLKYKYAQHPDSLFSISYTEALAYWELGEKYKAIDLMQQIAQMKPDFKSATELLIHWQDEAN